jgi:hypothetical protein
MAEGTIIRLLAYVWAAPVSVPAAALAALAAGGGSRLAWRDGVLEASGGPLRVLLSRGYPPMSIAAITLGHVVLAQSEADLDSTRDHERVHVAQYERWGALFPALYLGASLLALLQGEEAYRGNHFEREACRLAPPA